MSEAAEISPEGKTRVLIVDDHERDLRELSALLTSWRYAVDTAPDGEQAYRRVIADPPDILLTDLILPRMDGFELLRRLRGQDEAPVAVVLTAIGANQTAVDATRDLGAFWCCAKPVRPDDLRAVLERAAVQAAEQRRLVHADGGDAAGNATGMVGHTQEMQRIFALLRRVAPSSASVLITGESGTGKELVARAIHAMSRRKDGPFVAINCAAFPEGLVESELFGHEKGSFTGALERRAGCLEIASGGTLLLDEIGELPFPTQAKLLRVLDDSRVRRIGGRSEIQLDVRILAATNRNPEEVVRSGHFRQDLYYRLNVFHIALPPLRERREDLMVLCDALLASLNRKHDRRVTQIHPDVMECFRQYAWPGNVRELRNVLETAVILADEGAILARHLPEQFAASGAQTIELGDPAGTEPRVPRGAVALHVGTTVEEAERALIEFTLQHTKNNKSRAAKILGISPKTLHCKIKQYRMHSKGASVN